MQCTVARRVGIAMAPTIKNPPNQLLSLKPGQLWVGTRHTRRSWIISGHADCQGRCKQGTAWMVLKSVNYTNKKLLIFSGCDSLVGFGNGVAVHGRLLWQLDRAADEHGRVHERGQGEHRVWRPGFVDNIFSVENLSRWWQQWMWQLRRQTGVAPKQWVVSPILVGNINQISWNIEKHTFAGKAEHVQHWEARWQCDGAGRSHFLSYNYPTEFISLASGYRGDSTELGKEVSCVAGGTFCSSPKQRWTTLQAVSYKKCPLMAKNRCWGLPRLL